MVSHRIGVRQHLKQRIKIKACINDYTSASNQYYWIFFFVEKQAAEQMQRRRIFCTEAEHQLNRRTEFTIVEQ